MPKQHSPVNPVSIEIAEVYSQALAVKDAIIVVAAQDELLKRGDSDYVVERAATRFIRNECIEQADWCSDIKKTVTDAR